MNRAFRNTFLCLFGVSGLMVNAGPIQPIAANAVADKFRALPPENQRLAGVLASRLRANSEGFLERANSRELLAAYRMGHAGTSGGEAAGRFLSAAASTYEYRREPQLRKVLDQVANALADAQARDGYLGIAASSGRSTSSDFRVQRANLLGLLAYYQASGEERAYTASQKLGDYLVKSLQESGTPGKIQLAKADLDLRLAAAGLVEPLVVLYRYTAETAYLDLAKSILRNADLPAAHEMDATPLGVPAQSDVLQYDLLQSEWFNALAGMVELYSAAGEAPYLQAALRGWETYARHRLTITGTPLISNASEVSNCLTAAWMKLTLELLRCTGQQQFSDNLERTIYNQLLAGQDARNGDLCAGIPLTGKKNFLSRSNALLSNCALAESEGLSLITRAIWGRWSNGIEINLYTAGRGTFELRRRALVQVYSEASFPDRGDILLHVEPSRKVRFPLRLRVPEWAGSFSADYGGSHILGKPGEYLVIDREWRRGDTVRISIGMRVRLLRGAGSFEDRLALQRGPEILVLGRTLNPGLADLAKASLPLEKESTIKIMPVEDKLPGYWSGEEAYQIEGEYGGKPQVLTLAPFADAVDFAMWFTQPKGAPGTR